MIMIMIPEKDGIQIDRITDQYVPMTRLGFNIIVSA